MSKPKDLKFPFQQRLAWSMLLPAVVVGFAFSILSTYLLAPSLISLLENRMRADLQLASNMGMSICEERFNDLLDMRLEKDPEMIATVRRESVNEIKSISKKFHEVHMLIIEDNRTLLGSSLDVPPRELPLPLPKKAPGNITDQNIGGMPVKMFYQYFPLWKWHIVSFTYDQDFLAPILLVKRMLYVGTFSIMTVLVLTVFLVFRWRVNKPLNQIIMATRALAQGEFKTIKVTRRDEIAQVALAFNSMVGSLQQELLERQKAEEEIRLAAQKWRTTFDAIGDGVALLDRDSRIIQCNQAMADMVGKTFTEIIGRHYWEVMHGTAGPIDGCPVILMRQSRHRETLNLSMGDRWFHVMVDPILNEDGEVTGSVYTIADITDSHQATKKIKNLNLLLKAIKDITEALLRVDNEAELYQQTCDLLLMVPYIRFAWIGLTQPDSLEVKPVARAGVEEGYLSVIKVAWGDSPFGGGPTGEAFRAGQPFIRRDIESDLEPNPWREEALKRGYKSSITLPLVHEDEVIGVLKAYSGKKEVFGPEEIEFLQQVAGDIAVGVKSLRLEQGLAQSLEQLQVMMQQTVETMAGLVEVRDPYTAGHQQRATHLACAIAAEMGLDPDRIQGLRVSGFLHDIGKMVVPAEILSKPGKLSETEFNLIKAHSQVGADILKKINFPWPVAQIVLQHHERLDSSGYPAGLAGPDILLEAKILAVADVVEAISSHRPYRPALGIDEALQEISRNRGRLYDPEIVDICIRLFSEKGFDFE